MTIKLLWNTGTLFIFCSKNTHCRNINYEMATKVFWFLITPFCMFGISEPLFLYIESARIHQVFWGSMQTINICSGMNWEQSELRYLTPWNYVGRTEHGKELNFNWLKVIVPEQLLKHVLIYKLQQLCFILFFIFYVKRHY